MDNVTDHLLLHIMTARSKRFKLLWKTTEEDQEEEAGEQWLLLKRLPWMLGSIFTLKEHKSGTEGVSP